MKKYINEFSILENHYLKISKRKYFKHINRKIIKVMN